MAWEARSGLKLQTVEEIIDQTHYRLNGLGSPFGFETQETRDYSDDNLQG